MVCLANRGKEYGVHLFDLERPYRHILIRIPENTGKVVMHYLPRKRGCAYLGLWGLSVKSKSRVGGVICQSAL